MRSKKFLTGLFLASVVTVFSFSPAFAQDFGVLRADVLDAITKLAARYEARIAELEAENSKLRTEISTLKSSTAVTSPVLPKAETPSVSAPSEKPAITAKGTATGSVSGNSKFDALIISTNAMLKDLIRENGLSETAELGLFEFVNGADAFFISIDDGKNPEGITAFKTKMLFSYDSNLKTSMVGTFDLDYAVQKYRTLSGTNPYGAFSRTRVKNPSYKGKLLDAVPVIATPSSGTSSTETISVKPTVKPAAMPSAPIVISGEVTAKAVRAAYDKNKLKDAVALADAYLAKNATDVDILTVRYRSLYILGRYAESLKDIQAIEAVQGAKFDCTVAKDAAFIAKAAKNTELAAKYGSICKKP